ncbi:AMP-binding protein [Nocardia amamiensis]|uniref:AMP-binding protein n=1 Tax=Nocardia amamiensis TaxID=404578 RepID=UPI000829A354|nr:AMP-binding protein [Nocardia amamiensis]
MHEEADMRRRVRAVISDLAPIRGGGEIGALTNLIGELGYDSLRLMELTGVLETEFDLACAEEHELLAIETTADVEALVRRLAAGRAPANAARGGLDLNNFGAVLAGWAAAEPDRIALTFRHDDRDETLTYGRIHARAAGLAKVIAESLRPGERVMVLLPPGIDFVVAMFACFYAGVVAVAAPPPNLLKANRGLPRLEAIAADAEVAAVITEDSVRHRIAGAVGNSLGAAIWLAPEADSDPGGPPRPAGVDEPLLLQYTSGSTARPRGVVLTSRNLIANSSAIAAAFGHTRDSRMFSWLPPYHDMGLIGGIFQPLFVGFPTVLTSPVSILKRPQRWLEGIAEHRSTSSGGPNFAYDLCVHRIPASIRDRIDLSSWTVAFNGAEPVLAETIGRFTDTFAASGFRPEAFLPCYGLAEATLMVSAAEPATAPVIFGVDTDALGAGTARVADGPGSRRLVSSGIPAPEFDVHIIDPVTHAPAEPGRVGEIWIAGDSVASGYWRRRNDSEAVFGARIRGDAARTPYLRSGDLGVLLDGQLVVVGRIKDVIIVHGVNFHAHDIELAAESAHPAVRKHCSAAFRFEDDREGVGVVCEVDPGIEDDLGAVCARIRRVVAEEIGVRPVFAGLIEPGAMPKTASGKVQRSLCRRLVREGALTLIADARDRRG